MRKRGRIILTSAICAVAGVLGWWAVTNWEADLVYNGHPLSYWANPPAEAAQAARTSAILTPPAIDSNAVPFLIHALRKRDGALRSAYKGIWSHLPDAVRNRMPSPESYAPTVRRNACILLRNLGRSARLAIPELTRLFKEDDSVLVQASAALTLGRIAGRDDKTAIAALIAAARGNNGNAFWALSQIDPEVASKADFTNFPAGASPNP